jgi:hypothetical protein
MRKLGIVTVLALKAYRPPARSTEERFARTPWKSRVRGSSSF